MNNATEQLIKRLQIEYDKQYRSGVYGYTQRHLAYNSNKIEGSTLTIKQTSAIFDTGTLSPNDTYIRTKDIEEATGHFLMFNNMLHNFKDPLSEDIIKKYHYYLKSGVFEDMANGFPVGEYKNRANIVSDIKTTPPKEVPNKMAELLEEYNKLEIITLEDIAKFHVAYESIHPFQDGNGRTGRIIIFKECLKNNIFPLIIEDERKQEYYDALNEAQKNNDYQKIINFFYEEQKIYYDNVKDLI